MLLTTRSYFLSKHRFFVQNLHCQRDRLNRFWQKRPTNVSHHADSVLPAARIKLSPALFLFILIHLYKTYICTFTIVVSIVTLMMLKYIFLLNVILLEKQKNIPFPWFWILAYCICSPKCICVSMKCRQLILTATYIIGFVNTIHFLLWTKSYKWHCDFKCVFN